MVNSKKYRTKPITITVTKKSRGSQVGPGSGGPFGGGSGSGSGPLGLWDDQFSQFFQGNLDPFDGVHEDEGLEDAFFIKVEVDKTVAYEGEQIIASWYLYTRRQITDIDTLKYPSLNGFWKEEINFGNAVEICFRSDQRYALPKSLTGVSCSVSHQSGKGSY